MLVIKSHLKRYWTLELSKAVIAYIIWYKNFKKLLEYLMLLSREFEYEVYEKHKDKEKCIFQSFKEQTTRSYEAFCGLEAGSRGIVFFLTLT